jgi:hypothetical protein
MTRERNTLVYKRTHCGDPDPRTGVFGNRDCMGTVRGWSFNAVIGIGGIGSEPRRNGIERKLTWVGIGAHRLDDGPKPQLTFDHFWYRGKRGPLLEQIAPALARRMYDKNVRVLLRSYSSEEQMEIEKILRIAADAAASGQTDEMDLQATGGKCQTTRRSPCRREPHKK